MSTTKTAHTRSDRVSDDYLELVRAFPLRPLRSESEMKQAGQILDHWVGRTDLSAGQRDYLAGLVRFVRDFEEEHYRRRIKKLTPLELLKHLMRENRMNTSDLGYVLGSRGLASEVLNRKRGLSKTLIAKLARRFGVEPALFLDVDQRTE